MLSVVSCVTLFRSVGLERLLRYHVEFIFVRGCSAVSGSQPPPLREHTPD